MKLVNSLGQYCLAIGQTKWGKGKNSHDFIYSYFISSIWETSETRIILIKFNILLHSMNLYTWNFNSSPLNIFLFKINCWIYRTGGIKLLVYTYFWTWFRCLSFSFLHCHVYDRILLWWTRNYYRSCCSHWYCKNFRLLLLS